MYDLPSLKRRAESTAQLGPNRPRKTMAEQKKRVLLVDDDEQTVEPLRVALSNQGYEVLIARDGQEGISRAERDAPDLIILDVVMPKRSGFTVLERVRSGRLRSPHIIMLTANDKQTYRDFAESRGVDAYLCKPVHIDDLVSRVDALLKD